MCHKEIDAAFVHHLTPGPISVAYHENHKGAVGDVSAASDRRVWMFIIRLMVEIVLRLYLNPLSVAVTLMKKPPASFSPPQTSERHKKIWLLSQWKDYV